MMTTGAITGCKVFTATRGREREELGDLLTAWIAAHPQFEVVEAIVTQSSDSQFHCLTITAIYQARS